METIIKQRFARRGDKRGTKNVLLVGVKLSDESFGIGYSIRNPKDRPDKVRGEEMAVGRANSGRWLVLPEFVREKDVVAFRTRCERYFKGLSLDNNFS